MIQKIVIIASLLLVAGCKTNIDSPKMGKIESTLIAKGVLYGAGEEGIKKEYIVITSEGEWNDLITKMNSVNSVSDGFEKTKIDFNKSTVIAVFDEVRGSGGVSLELDINSAYEKITVNIRHVFPEGNSASVMTQPYHIVKIEKSDLPIRFNAPVIVK